MNERAVRSVFAVLVAAGVALGLWAVAADRSAFMSPAPGAAIVSVDPTIARAPVTSRAAASAVASAPVVPARPFDRPASFGVRLGAIGQPPPDTVVQVSSDLTSVGAVFDTVFAPYGFAAREGDLGDTASGVGSDALVVQVLASTSREGTSALALAGRNMLIDMTAVTVGKVLTGGQYDGTVVFVRRGHGLVPVLTAVTVPRRH